jgi:threonine dehydratase
MSTRTAPDRSLASRSARNDVAAARQLLAQTLPSSHLLLPTPLRRAASLSRPGSDVYLKIETGLPTGSFKIRGAMYSLSVNAARQPIREVVAASTGNHGAAVAYAARLFGVAAAIFLPANANRVKAARIRELGARIIEGGADLSAAIDAADDYCARTGAFFLHDATDANIPSGTGTIGAEIIDELPAVAAIVVPMGDTALVRGVAAAATRAVDQRRPDGIETPPPRIIGAVAERAPVYAHAWRSGEAEETASADTIADGLAVRRAVRANVDAIRTLVDDVVTVSEEEMLDAIEWLMTREGVQAEPAGAAATAAFLQRAGSDSRTSANGSAPGPTVLLVTGANLSAETTALLDARRLRAPAPPL